jgi:Baseplate J-like protein
MIVPYMTFDQLVAAQNAAIQANSPTPYNFDSGSVLNALSQANAGNSLWLQALASTVLSLTRLTTSSGVDVDSFIEDFGYYRPPAFVSNGNVTFSRFTTTQVGVVPVNTIVTDSSNGLNFVITADVSNPNYNASTNSYNVAITDTSMTVPAICQTPGAIGNVTAGSIDTIQNPSTCPNIDTVTNSSAFVNGQDAASDTQTKQLFVLYIQGQSKATLQAIQFAVASVNIGTEQVINYNVVENYNYSGSPQLGFFYVVINNGTGTATSALINAVSSAVNLVRGLTIQYAVYAALTTALTITVKVHLVAQPTETQAQITTNINNSLINYANSLGFNSTFNYSKISELVYDSDPNIMNVLSGSNAPTLNSSNVDVSCDDNHVFSLPSSSITVTYV